jgi:hypothetical protein
MNSSLFGRKRMGGRRRKLVQGRVRHFVLVAYWFGGFCLSFIGKTGRSWWPGDVVGVIWSSLKILYSTIWVALRF